MEYQDVENMLKITNEALEHAGCKFRMEMTEENLYVSIVAIWRMGEKNVTVTGNDHMILSEAFKFLEGIVLGLKLSNV